MEPFHEVQITLCVFNKTNDKNLKSPDAQTLNAPWSIVRHCESYCVVLRFAFSSDKRNILFSVLTTWLTTQGRVSHFVVVSGGPWYILRVWFWCHQMSLYDVSSPLPPCAWRPDSRTSWPSSPPWPSRWPCTDSPRPGSGTRLRGQRPRPHSPRGWQRPGARSPPAPASRNCLQKSLIQWEIGYSQEGRRGVIIQSKNNLKFPHEEVRPSPWLKLCQVSLSMFVFTRLPSPLLKC